MPVIAWIILIVVGGLFAFSFLYNAYGFFAEIFSAVSDTVKAKKTPGDPSDPKWTGRL